MSTCDVRFTGFGPSLDCHRDSGEQVGANVAAVAMRDPKEARTMLEAMFTALSHGSQRRELARGLAQLPLPALIQLAETKEGHALLERALGELNRGLDDGDNRWAADQIGTALKTVDFKHSEEFKRLDPTTRQTLVERLGWPVAHPGSVDTLIGLAKSSGFQVATPDTRR